MKQITTRKAVVTTANRLRKLGYKLSNAFKTDWWRIKNILPMNDNRIFISVYGGIVNNHAVNNAISAALDRLEKQGKAIERFKAHALRDTFATRYVEQGGRKHRRF